MMMDHGVVRTVANDGLLAAGSGARKTDLPAPMTAAPLPGFSI